MLAPVLVFALIGSSLAVDTTTKLVVKCDIDISLTFPTDAAGTVEPAVSCAPTCNELEAGWISQRMYYRDPQLESYGKMVEVSYGGSEAVSCRLVISASESEIRAQENKVLNDTSCRPAFKKPEEMNPCQEGFRYVKELAACYKKSTYEAQWSDSECSCAQEGGTLAIVDSAEKQAILSAFLNSSVWIGLSDEKKEGQYVWRDGSPLVFQNWKVGQPGRIDENDCVAMDKNSGFKWVEQDCSAQMRFLCEPAVEVVPVAACERGWTLRGGLCYKLSNSAQSWEESNEFCHSEGGNLASFTSEAQVTAVKDLIKHISWIGLTDTKDEGRFTWSDGTPLSYNRWLANQPDDGNWFTTEDCVEIRPSDFTWDDASCRKNHKALCLRAPETFPRTKCPQGWFESSSGETCYYQNPDEEEYLDAVNRCKKMAVGSFLMYPKTVDETKLISGKVSGNIWIGINDKAKEKSFVTEDGLPLSFVNFEKGEPNDLFKREDCIEMNEYGTWNDKSCELKRKFFCTTPKYMASP